MDFKRQVVLQVQRARHVTDVHSAVTEGDGEEVGRYRHLSLAKKQLRYVCA